MNDQVLQQTDAVREIAFYYPGWMWRSLGWIKNLILFFDGVSLLVPEYMMDRPELVDPSMVAALRGHDLLRILKPEVLVDQAATQQLTTAMTDIIVSGALDGLAKERSAFHELSYSRLGGYGDAGLADMIIKELIERGLARPSEDGVSIPLHPQVRALVLVLLAQILSSAKVGDGLQLCPATDQPRYVQALQDVLSLPSFPSAGHVVALDLQTVGVDLSQEPIEDILTFRKEHLDEYRRYARAIRSFMRELGNQPEPERAQALADRREEIADLAHDLRSISQGAWGRAASVVFGCAGAAWTLAHGDLLGAALSAGWALSGLAADKTRQAGAYTYIFSAAERFG